MIERYRQGYGYLPRLWRRIPPRATANCCNGSMSVASLLTSG